jgi:hypothetical protein
MRHGATIKEKISLRTVVTDSGCWEWKGSVDGSRGYSNIWCPDRKKMVSGHRASYEIHVSPIPDGLDVLHKCNNKLCVNPEHLYLGTDKENWIDRKKEGPDHNTLKTHCPKGHEYTKENTYRHPRSGRMCKTCRRERMKLRRENDLSRD